MKKVPIIILSIVFLMLVGATISLIYFKNSISKANNLETPILYKIDNLATVNKVGEDLYKEKAINSVFHFRLAYLIFNKKIKPGFYEFPAKASTIDIINQINDGKIKIIKITVPEGWRAEQIAARLNENKILDGGEFIKVAKQYEGELFPDTYFFNPIMTPAEVIEMMRTNYKERTAELTINQDDLALASIIEREAVKDEERSLIAGIYKNRIEKKMKLEADPTVQYGKDNIAIEKLAPADELQFKFWKPIKTVDYQTVKSEYNTYLITGLPKPICNPGIKSIEAALKPKKHNYYYFLQHDGEIYPAVTEAEHNQNRVKILGAKL